MWKGDTSNSCLGPHGTAADYQQDSKGKLIRVLACSMTDAPPLRATLKRGALIAAANWPLIVVQFVAEATLKLVLAVPVVGGIILVVLLLEGNADELLAGDLRQIVAAVFSALRQNPAALIAFSISFGIVVLGGSALTFMVKGGTVSLLAEAERQTGAIETPPLRPAAVRRAGVVTIDGYLDGCRRLWRRYLRLGACLLAAYALTAGAYLGFILGGLRVADDIGKLLSWTVGAALGSSILIVWISLVNLFYLLTQMVIAVDDVSVRTAVVRAAGFVRRRLREIAGVFGVVLLLVGIAVVGSILATAGLGLIAFVPFVGLAVVPLQVAGWLLRGFVFQYLALTALSAYLTYYRYDQHGASHAAADLANSSPEPPGIPGARVVRRRAERLA
jgi:hypothetical protein